MLDMTLTFEGRTAEVMNGMFQFFYLEHFCMDLKVIMLRAGSIIMRCLQYYEIHIPKYANKGFQYQVLKTCIT